MKVLTPHFSSKLSNLAHCAKPKPAYLSFQLPSHLKSASVVPAFLRYWEPKFKRVSLHNASLEASGSEAKPDVSFNKTEEHVDIVKAKKPSDTLTKKQMASSTTFSTGGRTGGGGGLGPFQFGAT